MALDVGTMLAALSLEATAAMVFAAGVICGSLLGVVSTLIFKVA